MLFTQPVFLLFFAVVFTLAWMERSHRRHKLWLLIGSYVFYGYWDWRFLFLIATATGVDFHVSRALNRRESPRQRRALLLVSLCTDLGILGFFKYFGFFVDSATALLRAQGIEVGDRALSIVLPVGISFYTFQSMSYTIDVYRRRLEPITSLRDYALFVSFFPQLVAGPIVRASHFLPQLERRPEIASVDIRLAVALFLAGFVKKVCIADNVGPLIDPVFADPSLYTALSIWISVLLYAVQIYCDFSGYTDMAIACAGLLGYRLVRNFDAPYLVANVTEFWRHWHISLSTWLRDYLYIALGGNRGSHAAGLRNVMLTMGLGGLWHGAAWTFVAWGLWHGLALVVHREWRRRVPPRVGNGPRILGGVFTLWVVCVGWIFFRAESFDSAFVLLRGFTLFHAAGQRSLAPELLLVPTLLLGMQWTIQRNRSSEWMHRVPQWVFAAGYGAAVALALSFAPLRAEPFIYFRF